MSPERIIPAIAIITVKPEISTERPEVAAAASMRGTRALAGGPLLALALEVEERVVDADGEADQQDHGADVLIHRHEMARNRDETDGREHGREREEQRHAGGDERAEDEQQDGDA